MKYCWVLGVLLTGLGMPRAQAQHLVRGTVFDAATGEVLPAANVQIDGTYRGTISNADGVYELHLDALPATLIVRYIGYETARRTITAPGDAAVDFRLQPVTYQLDEVVVSGEDPAVRIMREVIGRKKVWRAALETYETEAYNRFVIANDTGIVSIIETFTEAYWDREQGMKETLKGRRETANLDIEEALPAALFVTNLYDDDVEVGGYTLIGVTHPEALRHYRFHLEGTRRLDDRIVYDIAVEPRNRRKSAFVGRVSVLDSAYALIDVALRPGEAFLFPPPIERYAVTYRQQFSNFGTDFWLPVDFRADIAVQVSFGGLLSFPPFNIDQVSRFTDYRVNVPLPDSLFEADAYLTVDSVAIASNAALDQEGVAVPLSMQEQVAYARIDSTMRLEEAFAPTGLLARFVKMDGDGDEGGRRGRRDGQQRRRSPVLENLDLEPALWYNRVDAFHGGLGVTLSAGPYLTLGGGGGWSSGLAGSDRWSYHGEARFSVDRRDAVFVEAGYAAGTALRYDTDLYNRFVNGVAVLLGGGDYYDYYRREGFTVTAGYRVDRLDATLSVGYRDENHTSLARTTSYDLLAQARLRANPEIDRGRLRAVTASLVVGDDFNPLGVTGRRRLALHAEHSTPDGLGSDFDYTRVSLVVDWRQETFYGRRLLPNTLDLRLVAGTASGGLPLQRFLTADASLGVYRPFGALRTRGGFPYEGDRVAALFWEHNFRTIPFELLGLRGMARKGYSVLVFGGHARTWLPDHSEEDFSYVPAAPRDFHHEVGLSFSGLFGILRVDFARRLDAAGFTVGLGAARIF